LQRVDLGAVVERHDIEAERAPARHRALLLGLALRAMLVADGEREAGVRRWRAPARPLPAERIAASRIVLVEQALKHGHGRRAAPA